MPPYQFYNEQIATALHETDSTFEFGVDWRNNDLVAIKKNNTGSRKTEIHILNRSKDYCQFSQHFPSALHETDSTFSFAMMSNADVMAICKSGSSSRMTDIHILSRSLNYNTFAEQFISGLHETDHTFEFGVLRNHDLVAIKKSGTPNGRTQVHILSRSSGYRTFTMQTDTALHQTDSTWTFLVLYNNDIMAISKSQNGSKKTKIHILSAASGYQTFSEQVTTVLPETGDNFAFASFRDNSLVAIKKNRTGSKFTEAHILSTYEPPGPHPQKPPIGIDIRKRSVCHNDIPDGWIRVDSYWDPTRCGNPSSISANVAIVTRYDDLPSGYSLWVCGGANIPLGWNIVEWGSDPTLCGPGAAPGNNIKKIQKI